MHTHYTCFFRAPHPDRHPPLPDFYYLPRSLRLVWLFDKLCTIYYQSSAVLLDPRSAIWLHHTLHHILSRQDPTIITADKCWPSSSIFQSPRLHFHLIKHSWILDSDYHSFRIPSAGLIGFFFQDCLSSVSICKSSFLSVRFESSVFFLICEVWIFSNSSEVHHTTYN